MTLKIVRASSAGASRRSTCDTRLGSFSFPDRRVRIVGHLAAQGLSERHLSREFDTC